MRFLFDAHHLGKRQTGNETWVRNVILAMEAIGDSEVEYAVAPAGLGELRRYSQAPAHMLADSSLRRLALDLPRIARHTKSDAVCATYTAPLTRRPVVLIVHDASAWHPDAGDWLPLTKRLQYTASVGLSARRAAHVMTLTSAAKADLIASLGVPAWRISVAPAAVDFGLDRLLRTMPRRSLGTVFRVLSVGNVVPRKNLLVLARAVKACRQLGVPAELRIVGTVPKDGQRIAAAMHGLLGPYVHMTGYVTQGQLAAEYKAAAVLGFPSRFEGFGIPAIEAMAAGTPVVVSDASALQEVAGQAALVRSVDDIGGWRDALLRVANDAGLRDQLRRRGWQRAREYSWYGTAGTLLERLRHAAACQGHGRASTHRNDPSIHRQPR